MSSIGERIRRIRRKRGMTINQLAELIGVTPSVVSKYETGKLNVDVERLKTIAEALNVDPSVFFKGEIKPADIPRFVKAIPLYSIPASAGNGTYPNEAYIIDHVASHIADVDFAVKAEGDSMEPIVPDGSILLIKKTSEAHDGDMILCTYDDLILVKWFHKKDGNIYLISENQSYAPIKVEPSDKFIIHGVVMDVIRGGKPKRKFR